MIPLCGASEALRRLVDEHALKSGAYGAACSRRTRPDTRPQIWLEPSTFNVHKDVGRFARWVCFLASSHPYGINVVSPRFPHSLPVLPPSRPPPIMLYAPPPEHAIQRPWAFDHRHQDAPAFPTLSPCFPNSMASYTRPCEMLRGTVLHSLTRIASHSYALRLPHKMFLVQMIVSSYPADNKDMI